MTLSTSVHHPAPTAFTFPARGLGFYLLLVIYGALFTYIYATEITPLMSYLQARIFVFDYTRIGDYELVVLVTPLALLPAGGKITAAGQYLVVALSIFIFVPAPILFVSQVGEQTFYEVYMLLWLSYFIIALGSRFSLSIAARRLTEKQFSIVFYVVAVLALLGLLNAARGGLTFVADLARASAERPEDYNLSTLQAYATTMFIGSVGGFLIAFGVLMRRYLVVALAIAGYVLAYGIMINKTSLLAPAWIAYAAVMSRFFKTSAARYSLAIAAPFLLLSTVYLIMQPEGGSVMQAAFVITNLRLYVLPAESVTIYYDFFVAQNHPLTYLSHITFMQFFVHYPYGDSAADLMKDQYHMGTWPGTFLAGDGIAGFGVQGILIISIVFAFVLVVLNTCFSGLKPFIPAVVLAVPAFNFANTPMFTALLTGGLALLSVLLFFAPRDASWNK